MSAAKKRVRTCPACGRGFLTGKKAIVNGACKRVCLGCSANAVKVVTMVTQSKCSDPHCNERARLCQGHHEEAILDMARLGFGPAIDALKAMRSALAIVKPTPGIHDASFARGKVEGLEIAIDLLERHTRKS